MIDRARNIFHIVYRSSLTRFGLVGVANTATDLFVFFLLLNLTLWNPLLINSLSFTLAVSQSYLLNKFWSFSAHHNQPLSLREFSRFVSASLFSLTLATGILWFGAAYAPIWILKLSAAVVTPIVNYCAYRFVVFR